LGIEEHKEIIIIKTYQTIKTNCSNSLEYIKLWCWRWLNHTLCILLIFKFSLQWLFLWEIGLQSRNLSFKVIGKGENNIMKKVNPEK
jgi:hypothetical protein